MRNSSFFERSPFQAPEVIECFIACSLWAKRSKQISLYGRISSLRISAGSFDLLLYETMIHLAGKDSKSSLNAVKTTSDLVLSNAEMAAMFEDDGDLGTAMRRMLLSEEQ